MSAYIFGPWDPLVAELCSILFLFSGPGTIVWGELFSDALGTKGEIESFDALDFDLGTYEGWIAHNISTITSALR